MILHADAIDFGALRAEFGLPGEFPEDVLRQAETASDREAGSRVDLTAIPFVSIDPPGARDLDQAVHIEATDRGHRVRYAIADVGAVIEPGSALETESLRRGQPLYLPDGSVPLPPRSLSEGSGSLLPGETRPAVVWSVEVDPEGETVAVEVGRALVRNTARLDYAGVQADADTGRLHPSIAALPLVGDRLRLRGARPGAISLRLPAHEVVGSEWGWTLAIAPRVAADEGNAQMSLLVGRAAAQLMVAGGHGLVRTLPGAPDGVVAGLRRTAEALGLAWSSSEGLGTMLDRVDPNTPAGMAMMREATTALRGAAYTVVGPGSAADDLGHAGIGGVYAHVTAPLRRVVDRYGTEICLALHAGRPVPDWATSRLRELAGVMAASDQLAGRVDRACVDLAEALALEGLLGQERPVAVVRAPAGDRAGEAWCAEPPVTGQKTGPAEAGTRVAAVVAEVDVSGRRVRFDVPRPGAAPVHRE